MSTQNPSNAGTNWSLTAALAAAIGASACCTIPLALVSVGVGGAWIGSLTALAPYRWVFVAGAVGTLGYAGFNEWQLSRRPDCDGETVFSSTARRTLVGIGVLAVVALVVSPWLVAPSPSAATQQARAAAVDAAPEGNEARSSGTPASFQQVVLEVEGMTCKACSATVQKSLEQVEGVYSAKTTYEPPEAVVRFDPAEVSIKDLTRATTNAGYSSSPVASESEPNRTQAIGSHTEQMEQQIDPMSPVQLADLRAAFNQNRENVRLVSLLSPTCPECIEGHDVVGQLFERTNSDDLSGFIVWLPMRSGDDASAATRQAAAFTDRRLRLQGWDAGRTIGETFQSVLNLTRTAWDVYLVYESGTTWEGAIPPEPSFWMHQLTADSGADQAYCLNPRTLFQEVEKRLEE